MSVYVIGQAGTTIVKIGLSGADSDWTPPEKRVSQLEHTIGQEVVRHGWLTGGKPLEKDLHREFAEWRLPKGEWFELPPEIHRSLLARLYPWDQRTPPATPSPPESDPVSWNDEEIAHIQVVLPGFRYPKRRINRTLRRTLDGRPVASTVETGEVDYYTPELYVESARRVLGTIDLDPATSEVANRVVKAKYLYTREDDGLAKDWFGSVFLNPPWGGDAQRFVTRVLHDYRTGRILQAVVVLSAEYTDRKWMQELAILERFPVCFTNHRVNYWNAGGSPTAGTMFIYLGRNVQAFVDEFSRWGPVMLRLRTSDEARTVSLIETGA